MIAGDRGHAYFLLGDWGDVGLAEIAPVHFNHAAPGSNAKMPANSEPPLSVASLIQPASTFALGKIVHRPRRDTDMRRTHR